MCSFRNVVELFSLTLYLIPFVVQGGSRGVVQPKPDLCACQGSGNHCASPQDRPHVASGLLSTLLHSYAEAFW